MLCFAWFGPPPAAHRPRRMQPAPRCTAPAPPHMVTPGRATDDVRTSGAVHYLGVEILGFWTATLLGTPNSQKSHAAGACIHPPAGT